MSSHATGFCYCEKITFKVALPVSWAGLCSCQQCQKIHGSAFAAWLGFKTTDFEIHDPEKNFTTFNFGRADRGFCKTCGSNFYFKYTDPSQIEKIGDWIFFSIPSLSPSLPLKLEEHVFYKECPAWMYDYETTPRSDGSSA